MKSTFARRCWTAGWALLLIAMPLAAQSNASDAALNGYVRDPSGAVIPSATVTARHVETNIETAANTNADGYYRFSLLRIGDYELSANAPGFAELKQTGIRLAVGQQGRIDFDLRVGASAESISVVADSGLLSAGDVAQGEVLDERAVRTLPITSRNVYNFHLLGPGVKGIPSTGFGTTQFTFGGSNRSTWTVDGLDNTARRGGRQIRLVISTPESVEEMQVLSGTYSAEFGRAAGGVINVTSRSGSNDLHGSGLWLFRPNETSARSPLAVTKADQSWYTVAGNVGGSLIKDKLFYFINDEYNPLKTPQPVTITPAAAAALKLAPEDLGNSPFGETFHTPNAKLNFQLGSKNSGFIRYNRFTNYQPGGGGALTAITRSTTFDDRMNGGAAQLATAISPTLLNEFRLGVNRRATINDTYVPGAPNGAWINVTGVANFGVNPLGNSAGVEFSNQFIDNLTWTHGKHTMKFGIDYQKTQFQVTNPLTRQFTFGGLTAASGRPAVTPLDQYLRTVAGEIDPATGRPYMYTQITQDIGVRDISIPYHFVNLFMQDEFRLTPKVTLNLGLRYEALYNPTLDDQAPYALSRKVNNDLNNFAPRVGISWAPASGTVVRAGYGIYYDSPPLSTSANGALVNGRRMLSYVVPGTDPRAPVFPNLLATGDANFQTPPSITAFSPNLQIMYGHNASLQVERQLVKDLVVNLQYSYWGHRQGWFTRDSNLSAPAGTLADGRPIYQGTAGRPNSRFRAINLVESGGNSGYNGLDVTIKKRFSAGLQFSTTWSWSHAIADSDLAGRTLSDPSNRAFDRGNAEADVRHNWVMQGLWAPTYRSPAMRWFTGFEFSATTFYNSGYMVNATPGQDLNKDLVVNDRTPFVGRNSFVGPSYFQIDSRLTRRIRLKDRGTLELIAESENLTNRLNANCSTTGCSGAVVSREGAADFGRITSTRPGRNFQFGMRYSF
jgi:hypothetical protein